jgi:hypothetical protein
LKFLIEMRGTKDEIGNEKSPNKPKKDYKQE